MRPRTWPARIFAPHSETSSSGISVVISDSFVRSRSDARRCQAAFRGSIGHITESMPRRHTPRKINGATEDGRSIPAARPQAAIAPPYFVIDSRLASVVEPTLSTPPAQMGLAHAPAGADDLVARLPLRMRGLLDGARKVDAGDHREATHHRRLAGEREAVLVVQRRPFHAHGDVALHQLGLVELRELR